MNDICGICGFIKATPQEGMGYAGNICTGHDTYKPAPISKEELRQIVAEEMEKSLRNVAERFDLINFRHWSKDAEVPYAGCICATCEERRAELETTKALEIGGWRCECDAWMPPEHENCIECLKDRPALNR